MNQTASLRAPEVVGIDHIVLRTTRLPELLVFYREKLGLQVERHLKEFGIYQLRAGFALLDIVDQTVVRVGDLPAEGPVEDSRYDHFCLALADMNAEELVEWLDSVAIPHGPVEKRYGATGEGSSVYAIDPDGRCVELKLVDEEY